LALPCADNILRHMLADTPERLSSDEEEAPPPETRAPGRAGRANGSHAHGSSRKAGRHAAPAR
jgi:hypothetical protein